MREPMFEGPCAYARKVRECYEIVVYSTNSITHVIAGRTEDEASAERVCRRLNAYPHQTRDAHGLY